METRYGRITGRVPVFQALATLAWEPRRASYFRGELFNALEMVQRHDIEAKTIPGRGPGRWARRSSCPRAISNTPSTSTAKPPRHLGIDSRHARSIASYLKGFGWNDEETWGREVKVTARRRERIDRRVPKRTEGCYAIRNMTERRPLSEWQALGVRRLDGKRIAEDLTAHGGPGRRRLHARFLVYPNYDAILGYNCAHYYALTVALIADRLR